MFLFFLTMENSSNYAQEVKSYLTKQRGISSDVIALLEEQNLISYANEPVLMAKLVMRDLDGGQTWTQERYAHGCFVWDNLLKSKTTTGTHVGYFYTDIDFTKPVVIVEGEIDWMSALTMGIPNIVGLQGVGNLKKLVEALLEKDVKDIYLLVDNDAPANKAITSLLQLDEPSLKRLWDSRRCLGQYSDFNNLMKDDWIISFSDIKKQAKSLRAYFDLLRSFVDWSDWAKPAINHNNFSKRLIKKFTYQSADENVFQYNTSGIRSIADPDHLKNKIMENLEMWLSGIIRKLKKRDIDEIFELIKINAYNPGLKKSLTDIAEHDLNLEDGIFDVEKWELRPYMKEEFKIHKLGYHSSLLSTTQEPIRFLKFLDEVLEWHENKQELLSFLQKFIGHLFLPMTKYEVGVFLFGSWGNGKSVLLNVIKALIGKENISFVPLSKFKKDQYVYTLIGKLVNIDNEMDGGAVLDSSVTKSIVSWEEVSGKKLYVNPISFSVYSRLIIASNVLPDINNAKDDSVTRRFCFINFKQSFVENPNPNLLNELLEEKDLIFARAVGSLKELLLQDKLSIPTMQKEELGLLIKENDVVEMFLEEWWVRRNPGHKIANSNLYSRFKAYCGVIGERPITQPALSKKLVSKGFKRFSNGNERWFEGLSIVDDVE